MLFIEDPAQFIGRPWSDVRDAAEHKIARVEDYLMLVIWTLMRTGSVRTRKILVEALTAHLPRDVRRRIRRFGPLRSARNYGSGHPDLVLYATSRRQRRDGRQAIPLVYEGKLAGGNSQASYLPRLLAEHPVDNRLAPHVDLYHVMLVDEWAWQIDVYTMFPASYADFDDLVLDVTQATFVFFTGSATADVVSSYPGSHTAALWHTSRFTGAVEVLAPLLGTFGEDEELMALCVAMLRTPWFGPRRPDSYQPLLPLPLGSD